MNSSHVGWGAFVVGLGMTLGLLGAEITAINEWSYVTTPAFVGKAFIHVAAVIAAFFGGKQLPGPEGR